MNGLLGKKLGMTRFFTESGEAVPCTVIEAGPCFVTQVKTEKNDGYSALQIGFEKKKELRESKSLIGHFKKAKLGPLKLLKEFSEKTIESYSVGMEIKIDSVFSVGDYVKIVGVSKGRGFQGVVKRHHFGGGSLTHGQSDRVRAPGSVGSSSYPSRVFRGQRMAGRMGAEKVSVKNLKIVKIIPESNLMLIKGSVPGYNTSYVSIYKESK